MSTVTIETINALTEMIDSARAAASRARRAGLYSLLHKARDLGQQLDAARQLIIDHEAPDQLYAAASFVAAGTVELQGIRGQLDRHDLGIDVIAAERTEASDVIAWLEWHGIHLYPYQRRAIESHLAA